MEKFTKGEWSVKPIGELSFNVCVLSKGVSVYSSVKAVNDTKYDAALIAAAPEMYEMLVSIRQCLGFRYTNNELVDTMNERSDELDDLLAKARGEK